MIYDPVDVRFLKQASGLLKGGVQTPQTLPLDPLLLSNSMSWHMYFVHAVYVCLASVAGPSLFFG